MGILHFLARGLAFVKKYNSRPVYALTYGACYFAPSFRVHARFYSHKKLAEEIRKGRSFLRFGDGEMHLMNGGSIHYQKYEKRLELAMRSIVRQYEETSPYIIGLPVFINQSNMELKKEDKFYVWMPAKVMYKLIFPKKVQYGDAHFFYYDRFFQDYLEEYLLDKHLIVVSNNRSISLFKTNDAIPFRNVSFVSVPESDSYSGYERVCEDIDSALERAAKGTVPVLLVSAGPTSKQLVYDYAKKGYQSLDIGRGLEVLYRNDSIEALFPELTSGKKINS